ncbi:bifunctional D-cysteine desulfhydrase/1-aminocyclopropane-1-carboxylate deaminase, mitochondrial [Juglans microcarpa x Juglans regia]|uniref:bifunctional D-cysteine desulfhydrase/1-aminocyclopropane-1-carboxylate deaminase, mitochondrial n=1 Tax=Juglans microcarpa x Juglans regia TaxID=2249226 RepID=UPI001B7DFB31|nr:bifunctional D-cysteine desulfhydrase/1-aminocyclopropane-1-carboxylate deaminase, mitochondrial [Juglans microcarpa x Juglans regia]
MRVNQMLCNRWTVRPLSHPLFTIPPINKSFCPIRPANLSHSPIMGASSKTVVGDAPLTQPSGFDFLTRKPYVPPHWASHLNPIPSHVFSLGHLPTPIHKWNLPNLPNNTEVWLKRDDLSGMQLSGNKVRKLEFLMADAVAQGADCVITIGGIQSNHCRATAVAAKYLNLDCYLILRTSKVLVDQDPGLTGNLLVERLVGANVNLISKEEYAKIGSVTLTNILKEKLLNEGRRPYVIPVGGSNSLGTWGYIEAIREIEQQLQTGTGDIKFDDIVVACGSGGTIAGLSLGSSLSTLDAKVHAFSVCDDPDYFYDFVQGLLDGLGADVDSHNIVNVQNAKGLGYAINTSEELKFVREVAAATGVVLDPVYSGKAAYGMMKDMAENPKKWEGRKILFIHTGGLLGLFDKVEQMATSLGNWRRMDLDEDIPRKDGIGKMF